MASWAEAAFLGLEERPGQKQRRGRALCTNKMSSTLLQKRQDLLLTKTLMPGVIVHTLCQARR